MVPMLIIDTHAHLFSPDEQRYPAGPNPSRPPAGTGTLEHVQREMKANGVERICAIQVSGFYGFDNRLICDASKGHPDWIAGICTLDPNDLHSPGLLAEYVRDYGIRGMRSVPGRGPDGRQLDHPGVRALWKTALDNGITINLQTGHEHAAEADRLLAEFPDLRVALDHTLGLAADGPVRETLAALRTLARRQNCHTKLSFIANGPEGCRDGGNRNVRSRALRLGISFPAGEVFARVDLRAGAADLSAGVATHFRGAGGNLGRDSGSVVLSSALT